VDGFIAVRLQFDDVPDIEEQTENCSMMMHYTFTTLWYDVRGVIAAWVINCWLGQSNRRR